MSNVYGGLVSRPYNRIDTDSRGSVTYTYNGTVINGSAGDAVEVGGGGTPTPPVQTPAAQVFTDSECTTRPVAGGVYETLYVRLNRNFGFGDSKGYIDGETEWHSLSISTPTSEYPDDPYNVLLYVGWDAGELGSPITAGSVVPVMHEDPTPLSSSFTIDFYDE